MELSHHGNASARRPVHARFPQPATLYDTSLEPRGSEGSETDIADEGSGENEESEDSKQMDHEREHKRVGYILCKQGKDRE